MEYTLTTMAHDTVSDASGDVVRIDLPQTLGAQASEIVDELTAELIRRRGCPMTRLRQNGPDGHNHHSSSWHGRGRYTATLYS